MSLCFSHARRTLTSIAANRLTTTPLLSTSTIALPNNHITPQRHFSKKAKKQPKADEEPTLSYQERKDAAKKIRTERYHQHQARLERLKTRRDNRPRDVMKNKFRAWWDKELLYHAYLVKTAKREGKPWRIRVAAMVERLPVVTPDLPEWEEKYEMLRAYLDTYGREMPEFMPEDRPEDHIVETREELLAGLPFTPAPRETEHDHSGYVKTLDRQLKTRIYLTIKSDKEGNQSGLRWTLPSVIAKDEEKLLEAADRAVKDVAGDTLKLWLMGNTPMAVNFRVYNKNLPEEFRENYYGEKIFYYRVQYDSGVVDESACLRNGFKDFAWLNKGEIVERVEEERGPHQAKFYHYMLI